MAWNLQKHADSNDHLSELIKKELISVDAIQSLFEQFEVSPERLQDLRIEVVPLEQKYAETDSEVMRLNESMFADGWENFKQKYFFVIAHEIVHWLSRIREEDSYFNDPEEVLGFVASIAYEMSQGTHPDEIWNKVYPKVKWHFQDESDARDFFSNMVDKAKRLISKQ